MQSNTIKRLSPSEVTGRLMSKLFWLVILIISCV